MAKIGFSKAKYSKITVGTDESGNDTEQYGTIKVFAKAISATTSINTSKVKMYADNGVAEMVNEFSSGQLTFAGDDLEDDVEADVAGETVEEGTGAIINKDTDTPNYLRWGGIVRRIKNNVVQHRAVIFTKVMFDVPADDYETKGESIVFKSTTLTGEIMRNKDHQWRIRSAWMASEAEAETFLDENLAPKA
jgi:phi13 family phage major tail protein